MSRIEELTWDTEFFGIRTARFTGETLDSESWISVERECHAKQVKCLYMLANSSDLETSLTLEANAFHFADTRLTYDLEISATSWPEGIQPASAQDIELLAPLARESHTDSRFFFDPGFDDARCRDFYETWLRNSFGGFADSTLIAQVDGQPVGYLTLHKRSDFGQIGIIAVSETARGQGVGRRLMQAAHTQYTDWGFSHAKVVTQLRNLAAQRLYQAHGYRITDATHWYHRWF